MWLANRLFPSVRRLQALVAALEANAKTDQQSRVPDEAPTRQACGPEGLENVGIPLEQGFIDWVHHTGFLLRLSGWHASDPLKEISLLVNGAACGALSCFRTYRSDVAAHLGISDCFRGFGIEYVLPDGEVLLTLCVNDRFVYSTAVSVRPDPMRRHNHTLHRPLARNEVYTTTHETFAMGFPSPPADPELLAFLDGCAEPILDFGCGSGVLVKALRARGLDAHGLDVQAMGPFVEPEVKQWITLYDGSYPSAIPTGSFATVICHQVLEHIPEYADTLTELARLTRDRLILSVPDHSVLQICPQHLIPWHYLIADHYNFFNQTSLVASLRESFRSVEVLRFSLGHAEGVPFHIALLADCHKETRPIAS